MKIHHAESGDTLEVREESGGFLFTDSRTGRAHLFKDPHEAIWLAVEILRNISYELLTFDELMAIAKKNQFRIAEGSALTVQSLRNEKPIRTYYDQSFLQLISGFRKGETDITFSLKSNFAIEQEVIALLRRRTGFRLTMPGS